MNAEMLIRKQPDADGADQQARQKKILDRLRAEGFQSIATLTEAFQVSAQTIRRDVNALALQGLCRRSHGGIWPLAEIRNQSMRERRVTNAQAKAQIAAAVAQCVPEGASIFLGIGSTIEACAKAVADKPGLRVMTNNLHAAEALAHNPGTEITIAGGRVRNRYLDVASAEAFSFFHRYRVDIGIFGVGALGANGDLLDFHEEEAHMRSVLMQHCKQRFLLFDHSKLGRNATVAAGHITDVHAVFTDQPLPLGMADVLQAQGIVLHICAHAPSSAPFFPASSFPSSH